MKLILALTLITFLMLISPSECAGKKKKSGGTKPKKPIIDMNEMELEDIYKQWEENDDEAIPLTNDELPPHERQPRQMTMDEIKSKYKNPEDLQMMNKQGKSLMIFVTVSGNPHANEAEEITQLWQSSLFNANYEVTRYMMDEGQAIFMIPDGSLAMQIKNFLLKQERCLEVKIDQVSYPGINFQKKKKKEDL